MQHFKFLHNIIHHMKKKSGVLFIILSAELLQNYKIKTS